MTYAQPSLFGDDQPDLFGTAPVAAPAAHRVNPQHVINRFVEFDRQLQAAATWPWDPWKREDIQSRTWPYLLSRLRETGCDGDADHWQAVLAAHAARLDAATPAEATEA